MGPQLAPPDLGHRIAALADAQHGVVSFAQLVELGMGARAISRHAAGGRLRRIHHGVYAVGHTALRPEGWWMAAVLACGSGAVLSHRTAATVWQVVPRGIGGRVDVAVPGRGGRAKRAGISIHRPAHLPADDVTTHDGLPVTTLTRTLVDVAATARPTALRTALSEAERRRLHIDPHTLDRLHACPGARRVRHALADVRVADAWTRSDLERAFLRLCEDARLPPPAVNAHVAGFEVDFLWRDARVVVETDGHAYHHTRQAFEDDHARTVALRLAGYDVLRVTHRQVVADPATVIRAVRAAHGSG